MITPYKCIIVANGSFPQTAFPLRLLHEASTVIACDGAVQALLQENIIPDAIVGDLDSLPHSIQQQYADRIHFVEDQEINDLTKSVRFAYTSGHKEVLILGATGLREDHTLGNISLYSFTPAIWSSCPCVRMMYSISIPTYRNVI